MSREESQGEEKITFKERVVGVLVFNTHRCVTRDIKEGGKERKKGGRRAGNKIERKERKKPHGDFESRSRIPFVDHLETFTRRRVKNDRFVLYTLTKKKGKKFLP